MPNEIANTILQQLGGNRFLVMTGAKPIASDRGLYLHLPRISRSSCVVIHLCENDTYAVAYYRGHGMSQSLIGDMEGVYADGLRRVFESVTGLATSL